MSTGSALGSLAQQEQRNTEDPIDKARLIGGLADIPILDGATVTALPAPSTAPAAMAVQPKEPDTSAVGPSQHVAIDAFLGATLPPSPDSQKAPVAEAHEVGPSQHASIVAILDATLPAGSAGSGGQVESVLQRLITAMASFGSDRSSPLTTSLAEHEVEAARATLAANLHFAP
jgi:hypothetical protein